MLIAVVFAVLAICLQGGDCTICQPCSEVKCLPPSGCYKGAELVKDHCGCCDVCSKGYNEPCEGYAMMGKCSQELGLVCVFAPCKDPTDFNCISAPGVCKPAKYY